MHQSVRIIRVVIHQLFQSIRIAILPSIRIQLESLNLLKLIVITIVYSCMMYECI